MADYAELVMLVEGPTEQIFVKQLLEPYLAAKRVYTTPIILSKPGQKGGDVKFSRARNDIERHLKPSLGLSWRQAFQGQGRF